jgi:hypothetical protein
MSKEKEKSMPVPAYYLGRPASFWLARMSGPSQAPAASPAATPPKAPRPDTSLEREGTPAQISYLTAASAIWEAWGGNWFHPDRQPSTPSAAR